MSFFRFAIYSTKSWCIAFLCLSASTGAYASGGVHCQKKDATLPPVSLSWGAGHVIGSGRISPYRLTLSGRDLYLTQKLDPKHMKFIPKGAEKVVLSEVGYWNGEGEIAVWLADDQLMETALMLRAKKTKDSSYEGLLSISGLKGITLKDISVVCSVE